MNIKGISVNVGKALLISALFMFLSMLVSIFNGMDSAFGPLSISFCLTAMVGAFPFIFVNKSPALTLSDGFITIVLSWSLSFIFGMLPYVLWGGDFTLTNALFESVSGYTTTGATILTEVESLPKGLLFWRSSTHFIGGLGVVVFLLLVMPDSSPYRLKLANMEISSLSKDRYRYRSAKVVWIITLVYVGLTVLAFLSYWIAGMSAYDAINHAFSTTSTGGFSTKNSSIGHFDSTAINIITIVFMFLSSCHFGTLYAVVVTRSLKALNTSIFKYYFSIILVFIVVIFVDLIGNGTYASWQDALMDSSFNVVSYISTTGFTINDTSTWPMLSSIILMIAAIHCGCSGSTTGGIKADRIFMSSKLISNEIKRKLHPSSIFQVRVSRNVVPVGLTHSVLLFVVVYLILLCLSVVLFMFSGTNAEVALSASISSLGNVGPGLGEILGNFASQNDMAKLIATLDMFLGRIEIFPMLVVLSMIFSRKK